MDINVFIKNAQSAKIITHYLKNINASNLHNQNIISIFVQS